MKKYKKSLFVFHRDLRLSDNTGLLEALQSSEEVIPCFIFDQRQLEKNAYRSENCLQFMLDSLNDLEEQLQNKNAGLYIFTGITHDVIADLINTEKIDAVFSNHDYTPFSIQRDLNIEHICRKQGISFLQFHDYLLNAPDAVTKADGGVYTVFTPFKNKAVQITVNLPVKNTFKNYYSAKIKGQKRLVDINLVEVKNKFVFKGGRKDAVQILKNISFYNAYEEQRNLPAVKGTTYLSAHNKFGTVSIREVYYAIAKTLGKNHPLINEIYWRDFFTYIGYHHSHVLGSCFHEKYDRLKWRNDKQQFKAWCEGKTGFPIVDAGMRELNATGFMHNRVRMIVASFLVKDLHIDWRWGEKYFAQKLVDYDPLVNNGNWQWAASTGCDAQPYFRIFNPWRQQKRFDPECLYIKKWIPELNDKSAKEIHALETGGELFVQNYFPQIVDHKKSAEVAKAMFK